MNCKLIIVAIAFASLTSVAFAHDGHEHKGKPIEGTPLETGVVVATKVMVHPADASEAPVEEHAHH